MKKEAWILNTFFEKLQEKRIRFCVLRNYDEIPDQIGHDVDILIQAGQERKIKEILILISKENGWRCRQTWGKDFFETYVLYGEEDGFKRLKLDIWSKLNWRGLPWIDTEYVLDNLTPYKNFFIPTIGCEAAVSMIKELMGGGCVPEKYKDVILKGIHEDWIHFSESLNEHLLEEHILMLKEHIESGQWDNITNSSRLLKKSLIKKAKIEKRFWWHYLFIVRELWMRISAKLKKGGLLIAFIGPDGSGKTSVISGYYEMFKVFFPFIETYHTRFEIFPELRSGLGLSNKRKKEETVIGVDKRGEVKAQRQSLTSKIVSWIVVIYYTLEFVVGRIIFFRLKRDGRLVIFDRYYYDFFVQPNTRDLIWKWKRILLKLAPQPDLIIHLYADGETVYQRKGELNVTEINLQNKLFMDLLQGDPRYFILDTGKNSADKTVEHIAKIMYEEIL